MQQELALLAILHAKHVIKVQQLAHRAKNTNFSQMENAFHVIHHAKHVKDLQVIVSNVHLIVICIKTNAMHHAMKLVLDMVQLSITNAKNAILQIA